VLCVGEAGEATGFQLELLGNSRVGLKTTEGKYLRGENNGVLTASGDEVIEYIFRSFRIIRIVHLSLFQLATTMLFYSNTCIILQICNDEAAHINTCILMVEIPQ